MAASPAESRCPSRAKRPRPLGDLLPRSGARDWADLGDGPAGVIADLALANDVADYVRFRAVCRPWRRCSPDPLAGGLDGRFLPRQWIMLDNAYAGPRHRFLNVSTGECIRTDLPELAGHTLLALTPEGLLLLLHEPTLVVRLLNPLTHRLTDLPPMTALLTPEQHRCRSCGSEMGKFIRASGVGLVADASMVAVRFLDPMRLAVAKPGDESWTVVDDKMGMSVAKPGDESWTVGDDKMAIYSTLPFAGRFYCTDYMSVMVLTTSSDQQPPRLQVVAEWSKSFIFRDVAMGLHLVDNGRELMVVRRMPFRDDSEYNTKYAVYRVDLKAGLLLPAKGFDGRAVFMGMWRSITVSAKAFPSFVTADTIYLGKDCERRRQIEGCNIADGSRWSPVLNGSVYPRTIVDCLRFCIQGFYCCDSGPGPECFIV